MAVADLVGDADAGVELAEGVVDAGQNVGPKT
jgi:hypothetical protein